MSAAWPATEPTEVGIAAGDARLVVDLRGGGMRALTVGDRELLDGYDAGTVPGASRGRVLLPWPNRIRDGRWSWGGRDLQLELAGPDKPTAMHGLVGWQPWAVLEQSGDAVTVGTVV